MGAVVVMVELMQRSKVSSKAESKLAGILDDVCTGSRLCSTAVASYGCTYAWPHNVLAIVIHRPVWWKRVWCGVSGSLVHADFIQYPSHTEVLWKSVRWHESLVAALQGGL